MSLEEEKILEKMQYDVYSLKERFYPSEEDLETLYSLKSTRLNAIESFIALLILSILAILFYVFIYMDRIIIVVIIGFIAILIPFIPLLFRNYISRDRKRTALRYSLLSYISLEQLEKHLENNNIIFYEESMHPHELYLGYGFVMQLKEIGEISLEVYEVYGGIEVIFEYDLPARHLPLEWRLEASSMDDPVLDKVHYTVEFAQENDILMCPPKKELAVLFNCIISNWHQNPLTPELRELNAGERVYTIVEMNKNTCRIFLHLDDFTGNSADQQIVKNFFMATIPFTKDFSTYVHGQYEELSEQWKALLIN